MTMKTVAAAIKVALSNDDPGPFGSGGHIDAQESISVLKAAKFGKDGKRKTPVTAGEVGKLVDLFNRQPKPRDPMGPITCAMPENPGQVTFDNVANSAFKAFFANHGVQHPVVLKDQIMDAMGDLGEALDAPPDVAGLTRVFLKDNRPACGTRQDAFVDLAAGTFYLQITGGRMAPDAPQATWFGPVDLAPVEKQAGVAMREKLMAMKDQISESEWMTGAPDLPMGPQFAFVPLGSDNAMDGFQYGAYLPVGVVYPGAPQSDPNEAQYAFLMRSGGFAGMKSVVWVDLTELAAAQAVPAA